MIVSQQLTGFENYSHWSKAMIVALTTKNKIGFINGSCAKSNLDSSLHSLWERVNVIILSWIFNSVSKEIFGGVVYETNASIVWADLKERFNKVNGTRIYAIHKEIAFVNQGTQSVYPYYSHLKDFWDEYWSIVNLANCACEGSKTYQGPQEQQKLLQFLMGLNENFDVCRSTILMMNPLPTVNQAYSIVTQDESQGQIVSRQSNNEVTTALISTNNANKGGNYKGKKPLIICEHCNNTIHKKDNCWNLHGYPEGHKFYKPKGQFGTKRNKTTNLASANISTSNNSQEQMQIQAPVLTKEQYNNLLKLLSKENTQPSANLAGIYTSLLSSFNNNNNWIIDSRASLHMTSNKNLLESCVSFPSNYDSLVSLPNGKQTRITHIGSILLNSRSRLDKVFYLPDFKYNLLSVSKFTNENHCSITFYPQLCTFQDLSSGVFEGDW
ncbi:hypothetical protein Patl1_26164 [Pistacia atlantica]|uniref:Uncharacterized protein n=1 Tax=Pistacia atlantica TaxID=434234 RepID=A0ACC1B4X5_9ROSI|nr:hypothetical protein Patl1_26164 [Pistacia atlantica]